MSFLLGVVLASCGGSKNSAPTAGESARQTLALDEGSGQAALEERFAKYTDDVAFNKDGQIQHKDSKRSNFEGKKMVMMGGEVGTSTYSTSRYDKKEWSGTKEFDRKRYEGASTNRWNEAEYFLQKQARESQSIARAQGEDYRGIRDYETSAAREARTRNLDRPTNLESSYRQESYQQPLRISKEDYARMTIEDSKRLLGR
jgi:hypothetical protein